MAGLMVMEHFKDACKNLGGFTNVHGRLTYERRMPIKLTNYNCAAAFETSHGPRPAT